MVKLTVVYKIPYRRARAFSAVRPSARASKGILHTKVTVEDKRVCVLNFPLDHVLQNMLKIVTGARVCLITLHSNFEIFQKGHPAVEVVLNRRIFER